MKHGSLTLLSGSMQPLRLPKASDTPVEGQLAVVEGTLSSYHNSAWQMEGSAPGDLFEFTQHRFWALSTSVRQGVMFPVQNFIDSYVAAGSAWAANPAAWGFVRHATGVQYFTAPADGAYRIEAQGGSTKSKAGTAAATGGRVVLTLDLERGERLLFIVGHSHGWGGAGATVVWSEKRGLIAIAAGAGGAFTDTAAILQLAQVPTTSFASDDSGNGFGGTYKETTYIASGLVHFFGGGGSGWDYASTSTDKFPASSPLKDMLVLGEGGTYVPTTGVVSSRTNGAIGGGGGPSSSGQVGKFAYGGGGGYVGGNGAAPSSASADMPTIAGTGGTCFATLTLGNARDVMVTNRTTADSVANPNGDLWIIRVT